MYYLLFMYDYIEIMCDYIEIIFSNFVFQILHLNISFSLSNKYTNLKTKICWSDILKI